MNKPIPTDIFCSRVTGIYLNARATPSSKFEEVSGIMCATWLSGKCSPAERHLWLKSDIPRVTGDDAILNDSNDEATRELLKPYVLAGSVVLTDYHIYVKAFDDDSETNFTEAYNAVNKIYEDLDNYPILDEDDYSKRE